VSPASLFPLPGSALGILLLLTATTTAAQATEIQLSYQVLERLIAQQAFTDEGRKYVRGARTSKCSFAYLENPRISAAPAGRVAIKAKFTGRSAIDMFGHCVGVGDAFHLTVFGVPIFDKGKVSFKDISVETERDSFYIRKVRQALMQSLSRQFEYNLQNDAKTLLEGRQQIEPNPLYKREMIKFDVTQIRPTDNALVLTVDFVLAVK
jgi:hypothetical protein